MNEEWRDIPGWEGYYQVSNLGQVRSLHTSPPTIMTPSKHRDGYGKLNLRRAKTYHPHTLVALAFLGPRPGGAIIDHKDQDHTNHKADNLRYISATESNQNRKPYRKSRQHSGVDCVHMHGLGGYYARTTNRSVRRRLGRYGTIEEARKAVDYFRDIVKSVRKAKRLREPDKIRVADIIYTKQVGTDRDVRLLVKVADVVPEAAAIHQEIIRRETAAIRESKQYPPSQGRHHTKEGM